MEAISSKKSQADLYGWDMHSTLQNVEQYTLHSDDLAESVEGISRGEEEEDSDDLSTPLSCQ